MFGNYNHKEQTEKWNAYWKKINLYDKNKENHKNDEKFFFIDGPPYANAMPHIGHAFTRVLRESMLKYKQMQGHNVWLQLGFDTHGLPVSSKVQKELGLKTNEDIEKFGIAKFNEACKKHATKYLDLWLNFYEKLGSLSLWDLENRYFTFKNEYIDSTWFFFQKAREKDLIYKGKMTVPWCPSCETALSAHEASEKYFDVEDTSIFIKFPLKNEENTYFLVWTTTPWTLPGNVSIAVNEKYEYAKVKTIDGYLILAKELVEKAMDILEVSSYDIVETIQGKDLVGVEYIHLLEDEVPLHKKMKHKVIAADLVTIEEGTGLVHIAPGHGPEDYDAGLKNKLEILCPVDAQGKLTKEAGKYEGLFVFNANPIILEDLDRKKLLGKAIKIKHRYAHCPRCENKLIYRTSPQWFVKIEPVKKKMISENKKVQWAPDWVGEKRFNEWLENSRDWCISRQKQWGIPLPIWECSCGNFEIIGSFKELKQKSKNCPEKLELHKPYIDVVTIPCSKCKKEMKRVPDICDVWLDSGAATWASLEYPEKKNFEKWYPMDFITEGIDQTRGWFYTLMIENVIAFDKAPYKKVQVNGLILDDKGEKMSKSKGNVTDPVEAIDKHGADVIRWFLLWNVSPWENTKYDEESLKTIKASISTLWNVCTFIDKFFPLEKTTKKAKLEKEDEWILSKLEKLKKDTEEGYEAMNPNIPARALRDFIVDDLSRDYIKFIRNRIKENNNKEAINFTLQTIMKDLVRIMSPITPFIAEEIYQTLAKEKESVHLESWPEQNKKMRNEKLEEEMAKAKEIIDLTMSKRNEAGINVRQPLLKLTINVDGLDDFHELIKEQINVKEIKFDKKVEGVLLDTKLTPELEKEGLTREFTRRIQQMRKEMKLVEKDEIEVSIQPKPNINFNDLQKTANIKKMTEDLKGTEVAFKIRDVEYKITAKRV